MRRRWVRCPARASPSCLPIRAWLTGGGTTGKRRASAWSATAAGNLGMRDYLMHTICAARTAWCPYIASVTGETMTAALVATTYIPSRATVVSACISRFVDYDPAWATNGSIPRSICLYPNKPSNGPRSARTKLHTPGSPLDESISGVLNIDVIMIAAIPACNPSSTNQRPQRTL